MDIQMAFSVDEQKHLAKLAIEAQRNKSEAQKLALDAGKLLTVTSARFNDYKDRGFFKRCWYKISGKQDSLDRANQSDLISMQKFAWAYLVKLQGQNILEAQAIAVIRNNLKDLQSETAEIHDMISEIVKNFDSRIRKLEESTAMLEWENHVKATASNFDTEKSCFCFLKLVFECLELMRQNKIKLGCVHVEEYFYTAMKELGLNPDADYTVEEFISRLYEDVVGIGFGVFHEQICLSVDGQKVSSDYILSNVTGAGYNAVYQFDVDMANMQKISEQLSPEVAKEAMLKTVRCSINNGATKYSATELAMEILGGSLLTEELYREEHRTGGDAPSQIEEDEFNIDDLVNDYITIPSHVFLDTQPSEDDKRIYLESFALTFAALGGFCKSTYLKTIAKCFDMEDSVNRVELLSINPKEISLSDMARTLSDDKRKYTWLLDAVMIAVECDGLDAKMRDMLKTIAVRVFKLDEVAVLEFLGSAVKIASANDAESFKCDVSPVDERTEGWLTIANFKGLSISGDVARKKLTMGLSGDVEIVGLKFEAVRSIPFLPRQVRDIGACHDRWFVLDDHQRLWSSTDGRDWARVDLPINTTENRHGRIKVLSNTIVFWDYEKPEYCYSSDGCRWEKGEFGENIKGWQFRYEDFLIHRGRWFLLLRKINELKFSYEEGLIFKSKKIGSYDCSQLFSADNLSGDWVEVNGNILGDMPLTQEVLVPRTGSTHDSGFYALARLAQSYCRAIGLGSDLYYRRIVFSPDGATWTASTVDGVLDTADLKNESSYLFGDDRHWNRFAFTPIGKGIVFTGCDSTYFSIGGLAWRKAIDACIGSALCEVGKYYCGFSYANEWTPIDKCAMYYTLNGLDYKRLAINHRPCATCIMGTNVLLLDQNAEGGLFLGTLKVGTV